MVEVSDIAFEDFYDLTRSAMAVLLSTGSPEHVVLEGQEETGIILVHNRADWRLFISGMREEYLFPMDEGRDMQVLIFDTIHQRLQGYEKKCRCHLEPFMYLSNRQLIVIISLPEGEKDCEAAICAGLHRIVEEVYREILGERFEGQEIVSAVTGPLAGFGPHILAEFSQARECLDKYRFFLKGRGVVRYGAMMEERREVREAQIVLTVSELQTALEAAEEEKCRAALEKLFFALLKPSLSMAHCRYALEHLDRLLSPYDGRELGQNFPEEGKFCFLEDYYEKTCRRLEGALAANRGQQEGWSEEICRVEEFLERNFARQVTLEEIARAVGFNKTYLCSKYKAERGATIHSQLMKKRLEAAGRRLREGGESISCIAAAVGFEDADYFRACFKRWTGLTPTEYRKAWE